MPTAQRRTVRATHSVPQPLVVCGADGRERPAQRVACAGVNECVEMTADDAALVSGLVQTSPREQGNQGGACFFMMVIGCSSRNQNYWVGLTHVFHRLSSLR